MYTSESPCVYVILDVKRVLLSKAFVGVRFERALCCHTSSSWRGWVAMAGGRVEISRAAPSAGTWLSTSRGCQVSV